MEGKPPNERHRQTGQQSSAPIIQFVQNFNPFEEEEQVAGPSSPPFQNEQAFEPQNAYGEGYPLSPQSYMSTAIDPSENEFDEPPSYQQIPDWSNEMEGEEDEEDDPSQDPFIQAMKELYISEEPTREYWKDIRSLSNQAFHRNLKEVMSDHKQRKDLKHRKIHELQRTGHYRRGSRYIPLEENQKQVDPAQRRMIFPKRSRNLSQVRKSALKSRRRFPKGRFPTRFSADPNKERYRRLLSRSRHSLTGALTRTDPGLQRRIDARQRRKDEWRDMSHRKVHQKSHFKVESSNQDAARAHIQAKRLKLLVGDPHAPRFQATNRSCCSRNRGRSFYNP